MFYLPFICNKTERFNFKSGCVIRVVKHLKAVYFVRRRKRRIKPARFQVCVTSELRGVFLSNLACELVYIGGTTYINLVEIAPIVFKLQ